MIRARSASVLLLTALVAAIIVPSTASAATQVGFKAQSFSGFNAESVGGAITGQKPESKLWQNDGSWWAAMVNPAANGAHRIYRLQGTTWVDTGTTIDTRPATKEDVLSIGNTLYIASRWNGSSGSSQLRRFTYSGGTYTLDTGFPVNIPGTGAETTTIAKDSTGKLWITFTQSNAVKVAHTTTADNVWGSAFTLPVTNANNLTADDISGIISFTDSVGPAIGVMWSNQSADASGNSNDFFAIHRDNAVTDQIWTRETALNGNHEADDHINLKTFEGKIFAVVKTSRDDVGARTDPLVRLLVRSATGSWTQHPVALVSQTTTRPITMLNIDPASRQVYVFMSMGVGTSSKGIAYKNSSLDNPNFGSSWTTFIQGPGGEKINDATSTKQNATAQTGIVVMASDTVNYWWNKLGGTNTTPTADAKNVSTPQNTATQVTLSGADPETCDLTFATTQPAHGTVSAITNQACTSPPNADTARVTYTPTNGYAGPDSFTYTTSDGSATSSPATVSISVTGTPDFSLSASPTSVTVTAGNSGTSTITITRTNNHNASVNLSSSGEPLGATVTFNPDPTTGTSSTMTIATTAATAPGIYPITVSGNDGTATKTTSVSLTVNASAPADFSLSASPTSVTVTAGNSGTSTITITRTNNHNASVNLSSSGEPLGATVTFNPDPTTGTSSTMTIATTAATAPGIYPITVSGNDGTATKTTSVSLTVTNAVPTAANKSATTTSPNAVAITLTGTDAETCDLVFTANAPSNGSVSSITNNNCVSGTPNSDSASITYTPNAAFTGTDSFTYRTNDGAQNSALATVTITVNGAAPATITLGPTLTTAADGTDKAAGSPYQTASFAPANGNLVVGFVFVRGNDVDVTNATATITGGGVTTWTPVTSLACYQTPPKRKVFMFRAQQATYGLAAPANISFSVGTFGAGWGFYQFSGVYNDAAANGAAAIVQSKVALASSTSGTVTLNAAANAANRPIAMFQHGIAEGATPRANWTELGDVSYPNPNENAMETEWRAGAFETTASASWTTSASWCGIAAEMRAAGT